MSYRPICEKCWERNCKCGYQAELLKEAERKYREWSDTLKKEKERDNEVPSLRQR
jgi:hypothetical protein